MQNALVDLWKAKVFIKLYCFDVFDILSDIIHIFERLNRQI